LSILSLLCELYSARTVRLLLLCTVIFSSISLHLTLFCVLHTCSDATLRHRHWILTYLLISRLQRPCQCVQWPGSCILLLVYTVLCILLSTSYTLRHTRTNKPLYTRFYHHNTFEAWISLKLTYIFVSYFTENKPRLCFTDQSVNVICFQY
jgi:hypothetical protein